MNWRPLQTVLIPRYGANFSIAPTGWVHPRSPPFGEAPDALTIPGAGTDVRVVLGRTWRCLTAPLPYAPFDRPSVNRSGRSIKTGQSLARSCRASRNHSYTSRTPTSIGSDFPWASVPTIRSRQTSGGRQNQRSYVVSHDDYRNFFLPGKNRRRLSYVERCGASLSQTEIRCPCNARLNRRGEEVVVGIHLLYLHKLYTDTAKSLLGGRFFGRRTAS